MASPEPVATELLAQLVEAPPLRSRDLRATRAEYEREGRGSSDAGGRGYRYQTHPTLAYVERFVLDGQHARLSPASLETLAIIAYKQPIGRAQLSAIRGVNVDAPCARSCSGVRRGDRPRATGQPAPSGHERFLERSG